MLDILFRAENKFCAVELQRIKKNRLDMCAQNVIVTPIKDLKPGLHNLCLHFIVLDVGRPSTVKDNQVQFFYWI